MIKWNIITTVLNNNSFYRWNKEYCINRFNNYRYFKCQLNLVFETNENNDLECYYKKHDLGTTANSSCYFWLYSIAFAYLTQKCSL